MNKFEKECYISYAEVIQSLSNTYLHTYLVPDAKKKLLEEIKRAGGSEKFIEEVKYILLNGSQQNIFDLLDKIEKQESKTERQEFIAFVGDSVYQRDNAGNIYKSTIKKIIYETDGIAFDDSAIGQSVFLSEEDLKNKLLKDKSQ